MFSQLFNNMNVRMLGTDEEPFFYASDIGIILGIKNIHSSMENFNENEIVTPEIRRKYNLVTYKLHRGIMKRDDSIILLTGYGVYKLIIGSHSNQAENFRKYMYKIMMNSHGCIDSDDIMILSANNINNMQYVYFITCKNFDGRVKIGRSKNPNERLMGLQTGNPDRLIIYKQIPYNNFINLENILHKYCDNVNILNEWFELSKEQMDNIYDELVN